MNLAYVMLAAKDKLPEVRDWQALRETFRHDADGSSLETLKWSLAFLAILLISLSAVAAVRWVKQRQLRSRPLRVFHQFAHEFKLPLSDEWLLVRIARHEKLASPLTLMLSSSTLRFHASRLAQTLPRRQQERMLARVKGIDVLLFG